MNMFADFAFKKRSIPVSDFRLVTTNFHGQELKAVKVTSKDLNISLIIAPLVEESSAFLKRLQIGSHIKVAREYEGDLPMFSPMLFEEENDFGKAIGGLTIL